MAEPSESRELDLVGKVEFRIALADTDAKLSTLLKTYLAPLLLKLTSSSQAVRNKVISVCGHVNNRVKSPSIALPVFALLKQFREVDNNLVRHFDLLYIQQGIERIGDKEKVDLFFEACKALPILEDQDPSKATAQSTIFNLFLRLLPLWKLPERGSKEDSGLRASLELPPQTWKQLSNYLTKFLLLDPVGRSQCLSQQDEEFLQLNQNPGYWSPEQGRNVMETKIPVAHFLASGAFEDHERFTAAVILSAEGNSSLANIGDIIFKQHTFDLEDATNIDELFGLFFGQTVAPIRPPARPKLQIRILNLLSKSKAATSRTDQTLQLLKEDVFLSAGSGLEASRLRGQIFAFINWTTRVGDTESLRAIAPQALRSLKDYIESQGWPSPDATGTRLTPAEIDLRSHAYESIGVLSPFANVFEDLDLVRWLFNSLRCDISDGQIFVSIEAALGRAINAMASTMDKSLRIELQTLLQWQMQTTIGQEDPYYGFETKRNTKFVAVRFANRCLPFEDVGARLIDLLAISNAQNRQELREEGRKGLDPYQFALLNSTKIVNLPSWSELTSLLFKQTEDGTWVENGQGLTDVGPAVSFVRNILFSMALASKLSVQDEPEWDRKIDSLVMNDETARSLVREYVRNQPPSNLRPLLIAAITGLAAHQGQIGAYLVELLGFTPDTAVGDLSDHVEMLMTTAFSNDRKNQVYASRTLGIICSSKVTPPEICKKLDQTIQRMLSKWKNAVGQEVNQARGAILAKAFLMTRLALREIPSISQLENEHFLSQLLEIVQGRDKTLRESAQIAIGQTMLCSGDIARTFAQQNFQMLLTSLSEDAREGHDPAVHALGRLAFRMSTDNIDSWNSILSKLRDLHEVRQAELHFAVGEAISVAAAGWYSRSLIAEVDVDIKDPRNGLVLNETLISSITEKAIQDCRNTKPALRKAAAIWLLCIVQYCGHLDGAKQHLRQCQAAFSQLLGDRDEIVQESGSRGLGLVYEMGDEEIKRDLVKDLVQSFTSNNAKLSGQVSEDTVLFEEGALPTGEGASVKTYGQVVKLAQEVGQPSLVYRFMNLAANNAIWTSRAAFGRFGLSNVLADSTMISENPSFYPKLYRYRFDPNPNVRRSMNDIWSALVKDSNAVLDEYFDSIISDLLKSAVGGEWRVREASCGAISDLIQGRELPKYEQYLNDIWTTAFKVGLDDIKETVRVAGMTLIRTLVNILIRNLEVGDGGSSRAQAMLSHAIPFLLQQLHSGSTKEIQEYAVATIVQIIKKAPSQKLQPFAPQLIETLVTSLSSLEPEIINYIHLNASKYGLTSEKIDRARISDMGVSPIMQAIEHCLESLDENSMDPSMLALESASKTAIGLPSKVGVSRVIITLCVRHTFNFRPHADRFISLVRKQVLDRNETVSISYSMSLGYLMRLATPKQVEATISFVQRLYFDSEEASHRAVAGEIVQSVSKLANDQFMHFATGFLPLAFVAKNDSEQQIRDLFEKTWQDNVGGARAVSLYRQEIQSIAAKYIESPKWVIRHAAAKAIADLITSFDGNFEMAQAEGVWLVLEKALAGKTWDGKEEVVKALPAFTIKSRALWNERGTQMKNIAIREAKRNNVNYRPHAIQALGDFGRERDDLDLVPELLSIAENLMEEFEEIDNDKMEVDGDTTLTPKLRDETAARLMNAIMINLAGAKQLAGPRPAGVLEIVRRMLGFDSKTVNLALYEGAAVYCKDMAKLSGLSHDNKTSPEGLDAHRDLSRKIFDLTVLERIDRAASEAESLRLRRAELLVAYASLPAVTRGAAMEQDQLPILKRWMNQERSIQVRQLVESAVRTLAQS